MFAYFKGILAANHPTHVVLDVQGIGYLIFIPARLVGNLPAVGQPLQLFTSYVVREFAHTLYGFLTTQERDIFEALINITGIGPKLGLSLIGHLSFSELQYAVTNQDVARLCRVPGVGKKTAERLIVELKDKLATLMPSGSDDSSSLVIDSQAQHIQDAMLALINLGYTQQAAQKALKQSLKQLPETVDLPTLITVALKNI
jgi:holliday junction DNA helicase RuvA